MKINLPLTRSNVHNVLSAFISLIMFNAGETGKTGIGNTVNIISASLLKTVKAVMHSFMAAFFVEKRVKRFVLALFVMFVSVSFVQAQTLISDQADYPPGSTATLTGSGFAPNENVTVQVVHVGDDPDGTDAQYHQPWTVVADENGNFVTTWWVPDDGDALGATLLATADGITSERHAETTFTDAITRYPSGISMAPTTDQTLCQNAVPATLTSTISTCDQGGTGAVTHTNITYTWYYNTTNTNVISGGTVTVQTSTGLNTNTVSDDFTPPTDPTATGTRYYFCRVSFTPRSGSGGQCGQSNAPGYPFTTVPVKVNVNGINPGVIAKGAVQPGPGCGSLDPGITSVTSVSTGSGTITYTWQQSIDGGATWTTIAGATSDQYNPPSFTTTTSFKRIATSTLNSVGCSAESNILTYFVNPKPTVASITPGGTTNVCINSTLQLSDATSGGVWSSSDNSLATVNSTGLVTGVSAGDVTITYTVTDANSCSNNSNKTVHVKALPNATVSGSTTICAGSSANLSVTFTGTQPWSFTYNDGTDHTISSITSSPYTLTVSPTSTTTYTLVSVSDANCSNNANGSATVSVNTAPTIGIQPTNQTLTYGDASANFSVTATGTPAPTYQWYVNTGSGFTSMSGKTSSTLAIANPTVAMSGYLYHVVVSNTCTSKTSNDVSLTVNPKAATVTANNKSKTYGDDNPSFDAAVTGTVNGDVLDYTLATTAVKFSGVGDYPITVTLGSNPNYSVTPTDGNLHINQKSITITADAKTKIYGNSDPALTAQVTNGTIVAGDVATGSLTRISGENIGMYAINKGTYTYGNNYAETYVGANLTITQRAITITADAKSKTWGDFDPALTYKITSGSLAFTDAFGGSLTRVAGESAAGNPSTYAIQQGTVALNGNYILSYIGSNLSIYPRAITASASAGTIYCNGSSTTLTVIATGGDGTLQYKLNNGSYQPGNTFSVPAGGPYTVTVIDADGFTKPTNSVTVTQPSAVTATITPNPVNDHLYYGYSGDQTAVVKILPSGGTGNYTVTITMDRPLICNYINAAGDETWVSATTGSKTDVNTVCDINPLLGNTRTTAAGIAAGGYLQVTATLLDTTKLTITVTDANGCTYTTYKWIYAEDVRCFAGNSNVAKVAICHQTGSSKNPCVAICVDQSAVAEHLSHGDFLGKCTPDCKPPVQSSSTSTQVFAGTITQPKPFNVKVTNNPSFGGSEFRLTVQGEGNEPVKVIVTNMYGEKVLMTKGSAGDTYRFGANWRSGTYIVQIIQGDNIKTLKLIKGEG